MFTIQTIIEEELRKKQLEKKRAKKHWYASDLGKCLSGAYWARKGVAPDNEYDDRTLRVFECGNIFEDWIISLLDKHSETAGLVTRPETIYKEEYDFAVRPDCIVSTGKKKNLYQI